jgi:hypothetical protein
VKWEIINKSKKHGGFRIKNIQTMNISLLCKWWWKLEKEDGLWQEIIKSKYLRRGTVGSVTHKIGDSPVWKDLLKVKNIYLKGRTVNVRNGRGTSFWTDTWLNDKPLCYLFPILFSLCADKNISVYQFLLQQGQINFDRWLSPLLFEQWLGVVDTVYHYPFVDASDIPRWRWNKSGLFSTKSVYEFLTKEESTNLYKHIWRAKIPYKIKFSCGWWREMPFSPKTILSADTGLGIPNVTFAWKMKL